MTDELLQLALQRGECVLERDRARRVILLDGKAVITEGDGSGVTKHLSRAEAEAEFFDAIRQALEAGFSPARRDPPKPVAFVQPSRPPEFLAPLPPPPPRAQLRRPLPRHDWLVVPPAIRVTIDPFEGADWSPLLEEQPAGVSFIDIEAEHPGDGVELVAESGLPSWATGLGLVTYGTVEDYCEACLDPTPIWGRLGQLQVLELRAGARVDIPGPLPRLTELTVMTSEATTELLEQLCAAPWAGLTALELFLDAPTPLEASSVLKVLRLDRVPRLRHLALRGVRSGRALVDELRGAGLTSLVVTHSDEDGGFGPSPFPEPDGITVLSEDRFFPLRCARFNGA